MVNMRRQPTNMRPPVEIPTTVRPNIRPAVRPHGECWSQEWPTRGRLGDVRRCEHGKIQVLTETTSRRVAGPGTHWWRDLSRFWDWRTYRLAEAALDADRDF